MTDQRTILFLCDDPDVLGGLQRVLGTLVDAFRARGYRVVVTALELNGGQGFVDAAVERHSLFTQGRLSRLIQTVKVGPLHLQGRRLLRLRWLAQRRARRFLRKQVETLRPVAVIAFDSLTAKIAAESGLSKTKLLVQYHNSFSSIAGTPDLKRLHKASLSASGFLTLNKGDADAFIDAGFARVSYVHNPLPFYPATLPERRLQRVIALGRYTYQKGFDQLVRAWAAIPRKAGWHLDIYGEGPDRPLIKDAARRHQVEDSVTVHGPTWNAEQELLDSSIYALSSRFEGFGMVVAEAMACGIPVVATRCGPGPERLVGDCGLLSDIDDTAALAANLQSLIDDPALRHRLGNMGREQVQVYAPERIVTVWEELIAAVPEMPVNA